MADATPQTRWCSFCRRDRPIGRFGSGTSCCRECACTQVRRRRAIDYDAEFAAQGGLCAICFSPPSRKRLAIDHDHRTGRFRGLLCDRCNRMLGTADDSIANLRRAIDYLENPGREITVPPPKYRWRAHRPEPPPEFPVEISYREPIVQPPRFIPPPTLRTQNTYLGGAR